MSSLTETSTSNALRPNLDSSLTSRIPMRFVLQYSIASHNTGRSSFFFAPEMCYSKTLRISIPLYFAYSDKSSKVFRRAIYAIIHFGTEQHKSIFAPSEAADIKSVMQEYGKPPNNRKRSAHGSVIMRKANSLLTKQNIAIHSMRLTMSQRGSMIGRLREVEVESAYDG